MEGATFSCIFVHIVLFLQYLCLLLLLLLLLLYYLAEITHRFMLQGSVIVVKEEYSA